MSAAIARMTSGHLEAPALHVHDRVLAVTWAGVWEVTRGIVLTKCPGVGNRPAPCSGQFGVVSSVGTRTHELSQGLVPRYLCHCCSAARAASL